MLPCRECALAGAAKPTTVATPNVNGPNGPNANGPNKNQARTTPNTQNPNLAGLPNQNRNATTGLAQRQPHRESQPA